MTDPKQKIQDTLDKQKKVIDAQKAESERIAKEREQQAIDETVQSFQNASQSPNK